MKLYNRLLSLLLLLCIAAGCMAGCGTGPVEDGTKATETTGATELPVYDYVAETKLNLTATDTVKQEVTVKSFIDGDTTHFFVPESVREGGVLKARYLAINTPESTGQIEEWGKKASAFTKEKLSTAVSIVVESDDKNWNLDSTGDRNLVWVWYKPSENEDYRLLNLELIQNGLSLSSGSTSTRYGMVCSSAYLQAKTQKLHIFSGKDDPDFYYGDAYEIDLKGLRTNISLYENAKVAFEGIITRINSNTAFVEQYDAETDMYYGITVYYGYQTGAILNTLKVGNLVRFVGTVQYYEAGGTWQVSGIEYLQFKPNDPGNTQLVSTGHEAANVLTDPETFLNGKVDVEVLNSLGSEETTVKSFDYAALAMSTSISMKNLFVKSIYTTQNGGDSDGAMTLTCEVDGKTIDVRTIVLRDADKNIITADAYLNKTIDVTGAIDFFNGVYQIKVFTAGDIIVH